jgi:hypothetical protein
MSLAWHRAGHRGIVVRVGRPQQFLRLYSNSLAPSACAPRPPWRHAARALLSTLHLRAPARAASVLSVKREDEEITLCAVRLVYVLTAFEYSRKASQVKQTGGQSILTERRQRAVEGRRLPSPRPRRPRAAETTAHTSGIMGTLSH